MFPVRDHLPTARRPIVTYAILTLCVVVYGVFLVLGPSALEHAALRFGVVPAYLTGGDLLVANSAGGRFGSLVTPVTSMFLHGGLLHLLGNMWFLWVFGDNVEDTLGRLRFVGFYVLCGLGGVTLQVAADPASAVPMIGASGAISGVLAAYVRLHPNERITTLVPIACFGVFAEVPAFVFVFVWLLVQLISSALDAASAAHVGGTAWYAHLGGFAVGLALTWFFERVQGPRWEHTPASAVPRRRRPPRQ